MNHSFISTNLAKLYKNRPFFCTDRKIVVAVKCDKVAKHIAKEHRSLNTSKYLLVRNVIVKIDFDFDFRKYFSVLRPFDEGIFERNQL